MSKCTSRNNTTAVYRYEHVLTLWRHKNSSRRSKILISSSLNQMHLIQAFMMISSFFLNYSLILSSHLRLGVRSNSYPFFSSSLSVRFNLVRCHHLNNISLYEEYRPWLFSSYDITPVSCYFISTARGCKFTALQTQVKAQPAQS
jgi:hypothetical protein